MIQKMNQIGKTKTVCVCSCEKWKYTDNSPFFFLNSVEEIWRVVTKWKRSGGKKTKTHSTFPLSLWKQQQKKCSSERTFCCGRFFLFLCCCALTHKWDTIKKHFSFSWFSFAIQTFLVCFFVVFSFVNPA